MAKNLFIIIAPVEGVGQWVLMDLRVQALDPVCELILADGLPHDIICQEADNLDIEQMPETQCVQADKRFGYDKKSIVADGLAFCRTALGSIGPVADAVFTAGIF